MFGIEYLKREIAAQEKRLARATVFTVEAHRNKLAHLRRELAIESAYEEESRIEAEILACANI